MNACILVTKYVIIIEVYFIWNDIVFVCGYYIFLFRFSTILVYNNNYTKICNTYGHKSWSNVQYLHSRLPFIDIKGSNMIKMVVNSFSAIPLYFVYHIVVDNCIL